MKEITNPLIVKRYPTEIPLLIFVSFFSLVVWIILITTVIGLAYVLLFGMVIFMGHAVFMARVRGNGVRVSSEQLPEIYHAVENLAGKFGLKKMPEVYLIQSGGILNAMAAKFLRSKVLIIYSDLLEACGENTAARDMVLAHELGHIITGHLTFRWFFAPGMLVPFLGKALSRAREYTCDRYGLAGTEDKEGALLGLTILAVGKKHAAKVSREALTKQLSDLDTGWMRVGEWLSTHPLLVRRIYALDPALQSHKLKSRWGVLRGIVILFLMIILWIALIAGFIFWQKNIYKNHHGIFNTGSVSSNVNQSYIYRTQ